MTNPTSPQTPGQQAGYPPHPGSHITPPPQFQPNGPAYGPPPGPPPKKGVSKALIALLACVGLFVGFIVLIAIVAALSGPTQTTTNPATPTIGASQPAPGEPAGPTAPEPGATKDNPAPIGTEITAAENFPIKVTGANLNADAEMAKIERFAKPGPGKQYVIVDITATNGTGRPTMIGTHLKLQLLGASGVAIERSYYPRPPNELDTGAQMQPGVTISGRLIYEVPTTELDSVVLLAEPQFTLDENEDQRFLAIK